MAKKLDTSDLNKSFKKEDTKLSGKITNEPSFETVKYKDKKTDQEIETEKLSFLLTTGDITNEKERKSYNVTLWGDQAVEYKEQLHKFSFITAVGKVTKGSFQTKDKDDQEITVPTTNFIPTNIVTHERQQDIFLTPTKNFHKEDFVLKTGENSKGKWEELQITAVQALKKNEKGELVNLFETNAQGEFVNGGPKNFVITVREPETIAHVKKVFEVVLPENEKIRQGNEGKDPKDQESEHKIQFIVSGHSKQYITEKGNKTNYMTHVDNPNKNQNAFNVIVSEKKAFEASQSVIQEASTHKESELSPQEAAKIAQKDKNVTKPKKKGTEQGMGA